MEILRDVSLFWSMAHVVMIFLMLFRSKYEKRKTVILSATGMGILMVINSVGLVLYGVEVMGQLLLLTCSVPSFIFFWFLSRDRNSSYLFTFCLADTICLWTLGVTNMLDYYLGGGKFILMFVSRLILFPLLEWIIYKKFRTIYAELQSVVKKGWGAYAGMTVLYYILILITSEFPTHINTRPEYFIGFALLLVLMVFNYLIIFASLHRQHKLYESEKAESLLREQKQSLENQLENQQLIRKIRHDLRGHTITLQGLLKTGKPEEALAYLENMEQNINASDIRICLNPYINAQLSHYLQKFSEVGAELVCDIQIGEEEIPLTHHICSILSNALQNALEELAVLPPEDREVSLQMKYKKDYLIFRLKNRCREDLAVERGQIPATSKKGMGHGYGLRSIQETAIALGGDMICYTDNNYFVLDVMVRAKGGTEV